MLTKKRGLVIASRLLIVLFVFAIFFMIISLPNISSASQLKETYLLGEKVRLDLVEFNADRIKITTPSTSYTQRSDSQKLLFNPEETGIYQITIYSGDQTYEFQFTVIDQPEIIPSKDETNLQPEVEIPVKGIIMQEKIEINKPVVKREKVQFTKDQKTKLRLPQSAQNIVLISNDTNITLTNETDLSTLEGEFELEYQTPGPKVEEKIISQRKKEVKVSSPADVHYQEVFSYTTIPEVTAKADLVNVFWVEEGETLNSIAKDTDGNGLIDYVEWTIPHLSNQTFEISIDILNVKSLPVVGGNWEVKFVTEGTADLTITTHNGTNWSDQHNQGDLRFLRIMCDNEILSYQWVNNSVYIPNFSCNGIAYEDSHVLTTGGHYLEFDFGGVKAFAENSALDPYDNITQVYPVAYGETFGNGATLAVNLSQASVIDSGYSQISGEGTRLYVNETDWYKISYGCTALSNVANRVISQGWLTRNGQELVPSRTATYTRTTTDDRDEGSVDGTIITNLTDGDYLELMMNVQSQQSAGTMQTSSDCWMFVQRVRRPVVQLYDGTGGQLYSQSNDIQLNLDTETYTNTNAFTASTASDYIQVDVDGWYKIYYHACANNGPQSNRQVSRTYLQRNGVNIIPSDTYAYYRQSAAGGNFNCEQGTLLYNLTAGDQITMRKVKHTTESSSTTSSTTEQNMTWMVMEHIPSQDVLMAFQERNSDNMAEDDNDPVNFSRPYHVGPSYQLAINGTRINFTQSGLYEFSYTLAWDDQATGGYTEVCSWLERNGTEVMAPTRQCAYSRGDTEARVNSINANFIINMTAGDYVELIGWPDGSAINVLANGTWVTVVPLNIYLSQDPPQWLSVTANNTTPSINENVSFGANWYTPNGLKNWQFFWDLGAGYVPAASGNFLGTTNESSNTTQIIPSSMEGKTINYFFRAYDIDDRQNQTDIRNITVLDTSPPQFNSQSVTPQIINYSSFITIQANITDTSGVSLAWASIRRPDNTIENVTMPNVSSTIFQLNYTSLQVGRYNATLYANDTGGYLGNTSNVLRWNVTGFANVSMIIPQGGNYDAGDQLNLVCGVQDANLTTGIANYPITFWRNGVQIGANTTNSSGQAVYSWTVEGTTQTTLNCTIQTNNTLFYNANVNNANTTITVEVPNIELTDLTHENSLYLSSNGWYNLNWQYRKQMNITGIGQELTDFQVKIQTNLTSEYALGKVNATCKDIRFIDSENKKLDYWIQDCEISGSESIFWVNIPNITASQDATIYLYYGNMNTEGESNGTATFEFFDDFDDGVLTDQWTLDSENQDGTIYINLTQGNPGGALRHNPDSTQTKNAYFDTRLRTTNYQIENGTLDYDIYLAGTPRIIHQFGFRVDSLSFNSGYAFRLQTSAADGGWFEFASGAWAARGTTYPAISTGSWYNVQMNISGSDYNASVNPGTDRFITDPTKITPDYLTSHVHGVSLDSTSYTLIDNVRVRKYSQTLPTLAIFGEEEPNISISELNEYETTDNIAWINTTVTNNGDAPASNVQIFLNMLAPNGSIANWVSTQTQNCGSLGIGSSCETQFNNSGSGFTISSSTGGIYTFNITMNWSGGGNNPTQNASVTTLIHHLPDNFTGYLTDAEIPRNINTSYAFEFTNPWSSDLTNFNISINCPSGISGMTCSCLSNPLSQSCFIGSVSSLEEIYSEFLITTNASTPIGTYNFNVTVTYTNPTNNNKTWTQYENNQLIVRPLLGFIETYPTEIVRGNTANLSGYAHNIGLDTLDDVNLTWALPSQWDNITGDLYSIVSSLASDAKFYSNITVNVPIDAILGSREINITANSPNASSSLNRRYINVTATTSISSITLNVSEPLRNEIVTITAKLTYDNGTTIAGQEIFFQNNYSLSATTNASGDAIVNYTIPLNAPLGTNNFQIIANFSGNINAFILDSINETYITVTDILPIVAWNSPTSTGFGSNISIYANLSTEFPDSALANITFPNGSNILYDMILINSTTNTYQYNFSETWQNGQYNYSIWANNTAGFSNETDLVYSFNVGSDAFITLKTLQDSYIPNEIVNLSDSEPSVSSYNVRADQGLIIVSGTTNTAALSNTYQLNKSFIVSNSQIFGSTSTTPNQYLGRMYFSSITNGYSSQLTAERGSATNNMQATYGVIQADNIDVCHISHTMGNADGNDDISLAGCEVPLPSNYQQKCFVSTMNNVQASSTSAGCAEENRVMANLTSTTNLNLQRSSVACGSSIVEAQVVCFNDETNVTPVHVTGSPLSTGVSSSIGHTIIEESSWLIYSCQSNGDGIEQANMECFIDNAGSDVTCRTSTAGTSESSTQQCVAYAIEFFDAENSEIEHHIPLATEVSDVTQFNTTFATPVEDLNRTLGMCVSSFISGEGTAYARGAYPCYLQNNNQFACGRGQTGNTNPSNDFHCQIIQWPNQSTSYYNPSYIDNTGSTNISAYLLMAVLTNSSGSWEIFETILNDSATNNRRTFTSGSSLSLKDIWNGPGEGAGFDTDSNPGGIYQAYAALTDEYGNILIDTLGSNISGNYSFEVDFNPPAVILGFPENGTTNFGTSITVNYTATDPSGVDSCSIFHDQSGLFTLEETKPYIEGIYNNFTISGFTENTILRWNVRCNDTINNFGFTAEDEYFNMIVPPDFTLNDTDIGFQTSSIIEGVNMTINATIYNLGGQLGSVVVQFHNGYPGNGTQIGTNKTLTIAAEGGINTTSINWTTVIGPHQIYVVLDPPLATNGTVTEINETNNIANRSIDINSWQYFYGGAATDKVLANTNITNITLWSNQTRVTGNIFISDTENIIDWLSLQAMGLNSSGSPTITDFTDIDSLLNMTEFNDSVSNIFTSDGITPYQTKQMSIHNQIISTVPIINSTNTSNFVTGILWDTSDDTNGEFDQSDVEDLVFVSQINNSSPGAFGTYDYEIGIPVRLRQYDSANTQDIYVYFDLE